MEKKTTMIQRYRTEKLYFLLVKETLFYSVVSITDDNFTLNSDMIILHIVKKNWSMWVEEAACDHTKSTAKLKYCINPSNYHQFC